MAQPTGNGTETLHSHIYETVQNTSGTPRNLINGVQHHVYTVLSIIICSRSLASATNKFTLAIKGWDNTIGTTQQTIKIFSQVIPAGTTFVWNDKFSMFGTEPTGAGQFDTDANDQTKLSEQGGSAIQRVMCWTDSASDEYDITVSYIDQDWSGSN